jgi:glycosyltransferase involved in cell wall biosynthesis
LVARFDPQKDHQTFVEGAAKLHMAAPEVHFILCGEGIDSSNTALAEWITRARIESCCHLLGRREDVPRITAALDIASLSSLTEGFPNVIGEAMACGVPCVVTDVGECASIVGDTGWVVAPKDPDAMAKAWLKLIEAGEGTRARLGATARRRVETEFDITAIANRYSTLYGEASEQTSH